MPPSHRPKPAASPLPRRDPARNQVRIIGGQWRRSVLRFPEVEGLRPTPDRVRETLFNWLGQDLTGLSCLDLFSGTGALAFEAASRGASRVVAVERDAGANAAMKASALRLGASQIECLSQDARAYARTTDARFDVVFLDPPFASADYASLELLATRCLAARGRVYCEAPFELAWTGLRRTHYLRAGAVHAHLFSL